MEPRLEDYNGKESKEKRLTVYSVILSGLFIGVFYGIIASRASVFGLLIEGENIGIIKYKGL